MSQHVDKIAEHLYALTARKMKPLIVAVNEQNNYLSHHGELTDYHLPQFSVGQSCVEALPFLVGLEDEAYVSLPIVNFNDDNVCSVNVIQINSHRYIVLLEVADEYQREQQATQDSNEAKLLNQKLKQLTQQLEVANSTKTRFISGMSHEFRTPISSILGYSNLLANSFTEAQEEFKFAKAIESNTQYLLSLIDNVLEHAQLEGDKLFVNSAPFSLKNMITDLGRMFDARSEESKIDFKIETSNCVPEVINSDQIRLQQVLINLIGNAFKFTEKGSIKVGFDWSNNELIIKIQDTGPGIPVEHQKKIFQAYNRYDAKHKKGAGLGLAISAQIIEKLNGRLTLESEVGKGSTFAVYIEACPAELSATNLDNVTINNVLVVEDDEDLIELLTIYLQELGYNVLTALDGVQAIKVCESEDVGLVLLDMQLPILSGIEVAEKLRAIGFKAPIIAMTASTSRENKIQALSAGCNEFLSKPIQMPPLVNAIRNLVGTND